MKRVSLMAYTFVLMNWAAVAGLYHFARGTRNIWMRSRNGRTEEPNTNFRLQAR